MLVSLKTRNLSDARLRLGQHLREFERTLSKATGRPDPTASTEPRHVQPTLAEIDAAVRAWVKERLHNYTPPNGDVRTRLQGLEQEAVSLGTRYEFGEATQVQWLKAVLDQGPPLAVRYETVAPPGWAAVDVERAARHFSVFKLAPLFAANANDELAVLKPTLVKLLAAGGAAQVASHLSELAASRRMPMQADASRRLPTPPDASRRMPMHADACRRLPTPPDACRCMPSLPTPATRGQAPRSWSTFGE